MVRKVCFQPIHNLAWNPELSSVVIGNLGSKEFPDEQDRFYEIEVGHCSGIITHCKTRGAPMDRTR